ncbi:hypothetical protein [Streptomyces sennicomposti]|uniref:hypothetical protein n=1 Tax=Streptomyces sennicomposti TaxID=2873384 RepID=UPI001CA7B58E|nr:hypothetical protein [Streptomyces sennicomposti]MBY8869882.1 hypothetical protein [Streptomyces sennicomposti]
MSGKHAMQAPPSQPGRAVALLALIGLMPPAVILAPHVTDVYGSSTPAPVSRPDMPPQTCRCGPRAAL